MLSSKTAEWCLRLSLMGILGVHAVACGSDDSGSGKGTSNQGDSSDTDDASPDDETPSDGSTGGSEEPDPNDPLPPVDDTGGGDDGGVCADGDRRPCTCDDNVTEGEQVCFMGQFLPECQGCPCEEGTKQACVCTSGGIGSQTCSDSAFGECECSSDAAGPCPDGFVCQDVAGQGAVCGQATGGPVAFPPPCVDKASCTEAGLPNAECLSIPLLGQSLCVQQCSP